MTELPVVWLDGGAAAATRASAERALAAWARAHGVQLVTPTPAAPEPPLDFSITQRIEGELDRAREAIAAADAEGAEHALERAESLVREHPELPPAAWLRAEIDRSWSARWSRLAPKDPVRARVADEDAQALDGGRVSGIGETATPGRPRVHATFVVRGARPTSRVTLRVDAGDARTSTRREGDSRVFETDLAPAEHAIIVTADGRPVFATWAATTSTDRPVTLDIVDPGSCGIDELMHGVRRDNGGIDAAAVACADWVVAAPGPQPASVLVARCARDACSPLITWRMLREPTTPAVEPRRAWPAWATWTLVGVGAAAAATIGVVASGALQSRATESRFVVGGVRQE